ncbi:hypothetical protein [Chamaesiphon minutus]|uniref:hypothetical protein n=1 Tax=Chamaesiphon minutus TaxID=1173032 RepID=UPI0005A2C8A5|nr:hypothetical protein [Chamaesiphon minutus]
MNIQRKGKEVAHLLIPALLLEAASLVGFVERAIVASLGFHPDAHPKRIERGTSRLSVKSFERSDVGMP